MDRAFTYRDDIRRVLIAGDTHGTRSGYRAVGFSPRKQALAVYGLDTTDETAIARLGKLPKAKGCLYFPKLSDIDAATLTELIHTAFNARTQA